MPRLPSAPASRRRNGACRWLGLLALAFGAGVGAQSVSFQAIVPEQAYPGDHVYVPLLGGGTCNVASIDASRAPQVRPISGEIDPVDPAANSYRYELRYWLVDSPDAICGTPPPAPVFYADVGELPLGRHRFEVVGFFESSPEIEYETTPARVDQHTGLPLDIAGLWFDPEQGGRGLTVIPTTPTEVTLIWFTHDAQGAPLWVVSMSEAAEDASTVGGTAITTRGTPLAPGPATLTPENWGTLNFAYEGCGRARLSWSANDPSIGSGSQPLFKLAQSWDDASCAPKGALEALWVRSR